MVTGACGFIGSALVKTLAELGYHVVGVGRTSPENNIKKYFSHFISCDLNRTELNSKFLQGIDSIINLAGLAHNAPTGNKSKEAGYLETNTLVPQRLAKACIDSQVSKFIQLSSVKAAAETTPESEPLNELSQTHPPKSIYGKSKWESERLLTQTLSNTQTQLIILRPPLIYGPRAKGTLLQLIRLVDLGIPLPLKSSAARRSFISLTNLCTAIQSCLDKKNIQSGTFFVSDGASIALPELVEIIAKECGFSPRLFSVPENIMKWALSAVGKYDFYEKLFLNLEVKSDGFQKSFSWKPQQSIQEGIREMVEWYRNPNNRSNHIG